MTSPKRNATILFACAVAARLAFYLWTDFIADDAFITFRYARNLASGLGFVYNEGERVLGTTTPLFTFILSVLYLMRIPPDLGSVGISVLCSGLTAAVVYRYACSLRFGRLAYLPAVAYALFPRSLAAESCGMETAMFTLFVTAALYSQHKRLDYYAIGMATLATATRPEGGLLLLLILGCNIYHRPERWLSYLALPALLLLPWAVFAWQYFGSPIPNSIAAKLALYSQFWAGTYWERLVFLTAWHSPFGWVMSAAVIPGLFWLIRKQNSGRLEFAWIIAMIAFFTAGQTNMFFWYITPIYPIFLLVASAAACWLLGQIETRLSGNRLFKWRTAAVPVATAATAVVLLGYNLTVVSYYKSFQELQERIHREAGFFLFTHAEDDEVVAAEDIGYIGYYSDRHIIDRDGLVSPISIPYNRDGRYLDLILDTEPDWVCASYHSPISGFLDDSLFAGRYTIQKNIAPGLEWEYHIYSRIEDAADTVIRHQ